MAESSAQYHEPVDELSAETIERHRAIVSLMEELEAIDWYQQRIDAADDEQLREVLDHNREEEIEHAAMTLEWLRRRIPEFDEILEAYLFTDEPITELEVEGTSGNGDTDDEPLGIGNLEKES
ncbi:MAG: encapsulin-associated ferritin-like protein [Bradymonadaceae bacterium]